MSTTLPAFVRGDLDGFVGLALDNLVLLLLISALCRYLLGFDDALLLGTVLPGAAVSLLVGNLFYAWQARRLAAREGRDDVCALPFGLNTITVFSFVFLVMLPAKLAAIAAGSADPARAAWQAGLLACFGTGVIEFAGAFAAGWVRRHTPRAALLSTLAGLALAFIALGFLMRAYAHPLIGIVTLTVVLIGYFGRVKLRGGLPVGVVVVLLGIALGWTLGLAPTGPLPPPPKLSLPMPVLGALWQSLSVDQFLSYAAVIVPMGLISVVGSMQNLESAEAAGDRYDTRSSLAVNGIATLVASAFGSCFPTTLYIGHPGWKAMGARAGYSSLSGVFIALLCFSGTIAHVAWAVPIDAGIAILLWIGIVMSVQAFDATPRAHFPAVVVGLLPGLAMWGALMLKAGLRAAGAGSEGGPGITEALLPAFHAADVWAEGAFALEQGVVFSAMILSAATVAIIERKFATAAIWMLVAAALSATGLLHSFRYTGADTVLSLQPAWTFVSAYLAAAAVLIAARWLTVADDSGGH
ncbi:NCS2 family permease [Nevskia sp.]|uniref:NCS2 family permease n=1 Tax=Nevskia sp. TaxID=1929292 RepID=UPI0025D6A89B|nr:NCS2 family permease [Nevskia sp.]